MNVSASRTGARWFAARYSAFRPRLHRNGFPVESRCATLVCFALRRASLLATRSSVPNETSRGSGRSLHHLFATARITAIDQCDNSVAFHRNDIVISDCRHPFRAMLSNDGCRAIAVVPHAIVNSRAPWLRRRALYKFSNSHFLDLARRHMARLVTNDLTENKSSLLTENLCNLLALASANDVPLNRLQQNFSWRPC